MQDSKENHATLHTTVDSTSWFH